MSELLFAPAFALLPLLVTEHFGGGALQLGALEAAAGAGMIVGGVLLSVWGGFKRRIYTSLLGVGAMGVGIERDVGEAREVGDGVEHAQRHDAAARGRVGGDAPQPSAHHPARLRRQGA